MRRIALWLSLAVIVMMPWEDAVTIDAVGSLTRLVGIGVTGFWALTVVVSGRVRKPRLFHAAVLAFVLWNVASVFWTMAPEETTIRIKTYAQLFILVLVIWDLYTTPAALAAGVQAYVLGCWVAVISTIANYLAGQETALYSGGRYSANGVNAGDLALILVLGLPLAWSLAATAHRTLTPRVLRWVDYAYVPAALFAIVLSAARVALFAALPALLYIVATSHRFRIATKVLICCLLAGLIPVVPSLVPQSAVERLATAGDSITAADLGGRVEIWKRALGLFATRPLVGIGSGAFLGVSDEHTVIHNTFLSVLTEVGIVGLALFVIVLAIVVWQAWRQPREQANLWLVMLLSWAIGVFVQTWEFTKWTWLVLTLTVVSAGLNWPERETAAAVASSDEAVEPRATQDAPALPAGIQAV
jgi:O-antigen ligase